MSIPQIYKEDNSLFDFSSVEGSVEDNVLKFKYSFSFDPSVQLSAQIDSYFSLPFNELPLRVNSENFIEKSVVQLRLERGI